tara:strand:+ start:5464 stop:6105 length:642 start_codon:yes stop_codon:yes gene_type:complete
MYSGEVGELLFSWRSCESCGLHKNRKTPIHGGGDPSSKVVFVLDRTGPKSASSGTPYSDLGGQVLQIMLEDLNLSSNDIWCTTPTLCPTKGVFETNFGRPLDTHPTPKASELEACRPRLHKEIELLQPKITVACGANALKALAIKNPPKYKESIGRVVEIDIQGSLVSYPIPVMVLPSLEMLARDGRQNSRDLWNKTTKQINMAIRLNSGEEK